MSATEHTPKDGRGDLKPAATLATPDPMPAWMAPRIELLDTTDWDTAQTYVFSALRAPILLRFTLKEPVEAYGQMLQVFDGRIVDTQYIVDDECAGLLVHLSDDNGEPMPDDPAIAQVFVKYENLEAVGVY